MDKGDPSKGFHRNFNNIKNDEFVILSNAGVHQVDNFEQRGGKTMVIPYDQLSERSQAIIDHYHEAGDPNCCYAGAGAPRSIEFMNSKWIKPLKRFIKKGGAYQFNEDGTKCWCIDVELLIYNQCDFDYNDFHQVKVKGNLIGNNCDLLAKISRACTASSVLRMTFSIGSADPDRFTKTTLSMDKVVKSRFVRMDCDMDKETDYDIDSNELVATNRGIMTRKRLEEMRRSRTDLRPVAAPPAAAAAASTMGGETIVIDSDSEDDDAPLGPVDNRKPAAKPKVSCVGDLCNIFDLTAMKNMLSHTISPNHNPQ